MTTGDRREISRSFDVEGEDVARFVCHHEELVVLLVEVDLENFPWEARRRRSIRTEFGSQGGAAQFGRCRSTREGEDGESQDGAKQPVSAGPPEEKRSSP